MAYPSELRSRIVSHLSGPTRRPGDVCGLARTLGVSRRTLYLWLRAKTRPSVRRVGRPGASNAQRRGALRAIGRLQRQGFRVSCRSVQRELGDCFPVRLLQWATGRWKSHHARHAQRHRARVRVVVQVHQPDAIWGLDGTHLGRTRDLEPVEAQVLRDACSRRTLDLHFGRPACTEDVVDLLERQRKQRGALPLVLSTDNGPIYTSACFEEYLERHQVVHLMNLPHTPQHNAFTERGIGELKDLAGLGEGVVLDELNDARKRLARAWLYLDHCHVRPVLHGKTAAICYRDGVTRDRMPDRGLFYRSARHALEGASHAPNARDRRRAEREAIYATLESFDLVSRTRGGVPFRAVMCEGIS
jgi:transposase InsO family protein